MLLWLDECRILSQNARLQQQQHQGGFGGGMDAAIIFPGLPNDLGLQCLARVPRRYHGVLRGVSKAWAEIVTSDIFFSLRKVLGCCQGWLYTLSRDQVGMIRFHVMDPERRKWRELPDFPGRCLNRYGMSSQVVGGELYVMGGADKYLIPTAEVYRYNPVTNEWKEMPPMVEARSYLVSAVLQGRLYAIGGMGVVSGSLTTWEVYDRIRDEWCIHGDANIVSDLGEALVFDGKIFIRHVSHDIVPPLYAAIYDSSSNSWSSLDDDMTRKWCGPTAVMNNKNVYMLDQTYGLKLMRLEKEKCTWSIVGRISPLCIRTPCKVATLGRNVYVVGKGLKTIVVNVDSTGEGLLLTSSLHGLQCFQDGSETDDIVMSCHIIEL